MGAKLGNIEAVELIGTELKITGHKWVGLAFDFDDAYQITRFSGVDPADFDEEKIEHILGASDVYDCEIKKTDSGFSVRLFIWDKVKICFNCSEVFTGFRYYTEDELNEIFSWIKKECTSKEVKEYIQHIERHGFCATNTDGSFRFTRVGQPREPFHPVTKLSLLSKPMRRRNLTLGGLAAISIGGWLVLPQLAVWSMALATSKGEESSRAARDRIVFFGERSIRPTIASIEKNSPWARRYGYLPSALEKIGGSAHSDLLSAIKDQHDPMKRAYLISALQTAFHDYSQFDTVIADSETGSFPALGLIHMASEMRRSFPDAPELLTADRKLNPAFKAFWAGRSEEGGGKSSDGLHPE
jgi:hypothetical protein